MNCSYDEVLDNVILHPTAFNSKSFSIAEWWYSNIKWEALGILHGLGNFNHNCFAKEVYYNN